MITITIAIAIAIAIAIMKIIAKITTAVGIVGGSKSTWKAGREGLATC